MAASTRGSRMPRARSWSRPSPCGRRRTGRRCPPGGAPPRDPPFGSPPRIRPAMSMPVAPGPADVAGVRCRAATATPRAGRRRSDAAASVDATGGELARRRGRGRCRGEGAGEPLGAPDGEAPASARRGRGRRGAESRTRAGDSDGTGVGDGLEVESPPLPRKSAFRKIRAKTAVTPITKTFEIRSSMCTARSEAVVTWSGARTPRPDRAPAPGCAGGGRRGTCRPARLAAAPAPRRLSPSARLRRPRPRRRRASARRPRPRRSRRRSSVPARARRLRRPSAAAASVAAASASVVSSGARPSDSVIVASSLPAAADRGGRRRGSSWPPVRSGGECSGGSTRGARPRRDSGAAAVGPLRRRARPDSAGRRVRRTS